VTEFSFDIDGLDDVANIMALIRNGFDKEIEKFMKSEGNKLKRRVTKEAKTRLKKKTGNYLKGIKRGKPYVFERTKANSIRAYLSKDAPHASLIEYGHAMSGFCENSIRTDRVKGFYIVENAKNDFKGQYEDECRKFLDSLVEPWNR